MTNKADHAGGLPDGRGRGLTRALAVPLVFMVLHHLILNLAAILRLAVYMGRDPEAAWNLSPLDLMIEADVMTYASLFGMLILIPVYLCYIRIRARKGFPLLEKERVRGRQVFHAAVIILGAMGLTQLFMVLMSSLDTSTYLGSLFQDYLEKMALFDGRTSTLWLDFAATVLLVPAGEELLMRGIIQGELGKVLSPAWTIGLTTLLFALFHLDLVQGLYVLIAGFALSITYYFTRNILIPMGMHLLFNLIGSGWLTRITGAGDDLEVLMVLLLYACILGGVWSLLTLGRQARQQQEPPEA